MQFRRIKVLMLILFFLLDIFLLNWWRSGQVPSAQVTDANMDIITEMKKQKIELPKFSTSVKYSRYIAAQRGDRHTMYLPAGIDIVNGTSINTVIARFKTSDILKDGTNTGSKINNPTAIAYSAGYHYNPILTADKRNSDRVYSQRIEGLPVISDNGIINFRYNSDKIPTGFTQTQLVNVEKLREARATITEEDAIIALYRYNEIGSGDELSKGYLSYDRSLTVNGYDIYLPVWAFEAYSGKEKYVLKINAFTGDNLSE